MKFLFFELLIEKYEYINNSKIKLKNLNLEIFKYWDNILLNYIYYLYNLCKAFIVCSDLPYFRI